jgi:shikimate kinase
MKNIVLIGMPGAGKSTAGVLLAKSLGWRFIDTDILIQDETSRLLQEIIDQDGSRAFMEIEEQTILSLRPHRAVIATGGSVVYSRKAMEHLRKNGIIVYLSITFDAMAERLSTITNRGIVLTPGLGLREMYDERSPLYQTYADCTIDVSGKTTEEVVSRIIGLTRTPNRKSENKPGKS